MGRHQARLRRWRQCTVLRNALLAGLLAGAGFGLAHTQMIGQRAEVAFDLLAIPLGGYHWAREALEVPVGSPPELHAMISLQDACRPGAAEIVRSLSARGLQVIILNGEGATVQ